MGSPSPWAGILTAINGPNGILGLPAGVQPAALWFSQDFTLTWNGNASQNGIAGQIQVTWTPQSAPAMAPAATATRVAGVGTTPATLFSFAIPTGYDAVVSFDIMAYLTGGSGVGGHTGQRVAGSYKLLFTNHSGTPAISTGAMSPSGGSYWNVDESSGFLTPTLSYAYAANQVTVKVAGIANVNVDWSAVVTSISLLQE